MSEVSSSGRCSHSINVIIRVLQSTSWPDEHEEQSFADDLGAWQMAVSMVFKNVESACSFLGPFKAVPAKFSVSEKVQTA